MEEVSRPTTCGSASRRPDYACWSIEELRRFALQLRVRDARTKNRRELVELFEGSVRA